MAHGEGVPLANFCEALLPFRTAEYRVQLVDMLRGEGIGTPTDFLRVSQQALTSKLETRAGFTVIQVADVVSLRNSAQEGVSSEQGGRQEHTAGRDRSRSKGRYGRKRYQDGDRRGDRRRRQGDGQRGGQVGGNEDRPRQQKPDLWRAVESGEADEVRLCLSRGDDAEEKYLGWSPLMKASEEGHVEIMQVLLEKRVDLEVSNKKGRTALSFAAAPSMKRETPLPALKLLLDSGADMRHKDESGLTPKEKAEKEERQDAISLLEEYEASYLQRAAAGLVDAVFEP